MIYKKYRMFIFLGLILGLLLFGCAKKENSQAFIERIPGNNGIANCYIVGDTNSGKAAIIDTTSDINAIEKLLNKDKLTPEYILLTHGHFDHIQGIEGLKVKYPNIKVYVHTKDWAMLSDPAINMSQSFINQKITAKADKTLQDGQIINLGDTKIQVIHTPGHTPGSVTFHVNKVLFTGDTLFKDSIGRTDFPGGSQGDLDASIRDKLLKYPDDTIIYPGHGDSSTIGAERRYF